MATTLVGLLQERLRENGARVAVRQDGESWSWQELAGSAMRFAQELRELRVQPQQRVVYVGKNDVACLVALFGCALVRAVYVPMNWRLSAGELAGLLEDADPATVVVEDAMRGPIDRWMAQSGRSVPVMGSGRLRERAEVVAEIVDVDTRSDDIAFHLYTSGTTGRPKAAMFACEGNVEALLGPISRAWDFRRDDVSLLCLPLFHMGGLAWALAGMAAGVTSVVMRDFDAEDVLDTCERERVTMLFLVPVMVSAVVAGIGGRERELAVRRLTYSGAPVAPSMLIAAIDGLGCDFVQIYGLTEATGAFAQLEPADHDPGGPREHLLLSAGRVSPWVEARATNPASGETQRAGFSGEIWTRSGQNLIGYFGQPEQTAAALTGDGWLRTGDIGLMDEEGYLFLLDRRKDMIISGGENVYPAEVEKVLVEHPAVAEVAVIGVPSDRWGETPLAVVVPKPGREVVAQELMTFARERLAAFKCPTRIEVAEVLPRTATGKVRKDLVREPYWAGRERRIG